MKLKGIYKNEAGSETDVKSGTAKVSVVDPAGTYKVTATAATKEVGTTSEYYYLYDIPSNAIAGTWKHKWIGTISTAVDNYYAVEWKAFAVKEKI